MIRARTIAAMMGVAALMLVVTTLRASGATPLDVPFHRQQKDGCGAASVAMVLHYWQLKQPQIAGPLPAANEVYRALYQPELRGIPLGEMKQFMHAQGMSAFTLRGTTTDLQQQLRKGRPLIVATKAGERKPTHFVVITGVEEGAVWMNDPTRKKPRRMALKQFQKQWARADGWLLLAAPSRSLVTGQPSPPTEAETLSPQSGQ